MGNFGRFRDEKIKAAYERFMSTSNNLSKRS
jgi:hypothetical protein